MKIVKADAKGRVTGFEPGRMYTTREQAGRTTVERFEPPQKEGHMRVDYHVRPLLGATITLDLPGSITEIGEYVEEIKLLCSPDKVEVVTDGMGVALSRVLDDRGVEHTQVNR